MFRFNSRPSSLCNRIATFPKRLLLISFALLLGVLSPRVDAQTSVGAYSISTITTTYNSNSSLFQSQPWFNDGNSAATLAIYASLVMGPYANPQGIDNLYNGWGFSTSSIGPVFVSTGFGGDNIYGSAYNETALIDPNRNFTFAIVSGSDGGGGGSAGVPEIDGSLVPQVGFLLACLFLMFGRKKENTESLMTT